MRQAITFPLDLRDRLVTTITERFPEKSFGYLLSDTRPTEPKDFVLFHENIRNDAQWQPRFRAYGRYFVEHDDAGFVASPEEAWRVQKEIWRRGMSEIAAFHSHQRHPGNFSRIDYDLHVARFERLWHLIVSLRNPALPQLRAFDVTAHGVVEVPLEVADG